MPFDNTPPETTTNTELLILRRARKGIADHRKWCKREADNGRGARCAIGWIGYAAIELEAISFVPAAQRLLHAALPPPWRVGDWSPGDCIMNFNDKHTTTHRKIVTLFDRAIALAKR